MSKPVKGNKTKRAPSDELRLKKAHLNFLKREVAILSSRTEVPEGFKVTTINASKIRIKGAGAQAIKQSSDKNRTEVIKAVAERNWTKVVGLVPYEAAPKVDYKIERVTQEPTKKEVKKVS